MTTKSEIPLTDSEIHAILLNALHTASDVYKKHASEALVQGYGRIADQFLCQVANADGLRSRIEDADYVVLVTNLP